MRLKKPDREFFRKLLENLIVKNPKFFKAMSIGPSLRMRRDRLANGL
jgi:hypothetical protein